MTLKLQPDDAPEPFKGSYTYTPTLKPLIRAFIYTLDKRGVIRYENRHHTPLLTVRLLESGSGTATTELLWLHSSGVGNQQGLVVRSKDLLKLVLRGLVDVLLVVSNQTLGNSLSDGVDLRDVTTTGDLDSDVDVGELVETGQRQWLVDLETQDLWLHQGDWDTVDLDQTLTGLDKRDGSGGSLLTESLDVSMRWGMVI